MPTGFSLCIKGLNLERLALIIGFGLSLAAAMGSQFYLAPVADRIQNTTQTLDETWARLKIIRSANALFGLLQSFDTLVHLVPADFSANPSGADVIAEIGTRALHDRHEAVRNYFAQASSAGEIDYRNTVRRYDELVAAETADWNLKTYSATNALPAEVNMKVATDRWQLEKESYQLEADFYRLRLQRDDRAWVMTLLNTLGASILFILTILMARDQPAPPGFRNDFSKAAALMNLALLEMRRQIAEAKTGP